MTKEEIFKNEIELLRQELIEKHIKLGMKASGDWERTLNAIITITSSSFSAEIRGNNYTEYLTKGREPGSLPPYDAIDQWVTDKGITPAEGVSREALVEKLRWKIKLYGTNYYISGGTDLIDSVITPERIQKIVDAMGMSMVANLKLEINEILLRQ